MDIPDDILREIDDGPLDELIGYYVFSLNFDGNAGDEIKAIREWVANAILAERRRCADAAFKAVDSLTTDDLDDSFIGKQATFSDSIDLAAATARDAIIAKHTTIRGDRHG